MGKGRFLFCDIPQPSNDWVCAVLLFQHESYKAFKKRWERNSRGDKSYDHQTVWPALLGDKSLGDALLFICCTRCQQWHWGSAGPPRCPMNHIRCFLSSAPEFPVQLLSCNWRLLWLFLQVFVILSIPPPYASSVPRLSQSHCGRSSTFHDATSAQNAESVEAQMSIWAMSHVTEACSHQQFQ